ncbi:TetR/AcrR family transcriptional regulator [Sphingomonas sp. CL5.1]|uniref:TetR/AcrR family transcriptional regulator n=1 Tax=Sphingomonas sp. CL5.1 TaxID=2653203 RepID=UPI001582D824|nr:TetR/AcrR family transcriptional regulator [Sphingomonas sp. CL5.1]QKR99916.1 TetR/AcrR family transcriptional regulator [Sphingomonas sp. CL5.1]
MKPIKHDRGMATRRSILDAAETVFADVGYAASRMEDVATAVGIRRPSIIYYFPSKQELYDAVESDIFAAMHTFTAARLDGVAKPVDRLLALLDAWLDFLVSRPAAARIILRNVADTTPRHGDPVQFSDKVLRDIEAIVEDGVAAGDFRTVPAMQIVNAVGGGILFYVCNADQLGRQRTYDAADPTEKESFRRLLHLNAKAAVANG